uniref:Ring finger and CHY zinc finger domain containing 1 n=1 Tax=Apteryx owenii TaxID=8824 RepID=A0A8B9PIJ5_APTOW
GGGTGGRAGAAVEGWVPPLRCPVPLQAPCCGKLYACRLCHDGAEGHRLDRFRVAEVQCARCRRLQKVGTAGAAAAARGPPFRGWGRRRRVPNGRLLSLPLPSPRRAGAAAAGAAELRGLPQPLRGILLRHLPSFRPRQEAVPLRRVRHLQDIHTSRVGAHVLPCGHLLHRTCYEDMLKEGYRCPLCMHSALDMTRYWRQLDDEVAQTPMPTEYQNMMVEILCNDCNARSTVQFHLLGMKCTNCESYNTAQDGKCRLTLE